MTECVRALGVSPGRWLRAVVLDAVEDHRSHVTEIEDAAKTTGVPVDPAAVEQLRRVGVNLNQAVRRGLVHRADVADVMAAVDAMRSSLGDRTAS